MTTTEVDRAPTRATRVGAVVAKLAPKRIAYYQEYGVWPTQDEIDQDSPSAPTYSKVRTVVDGNEVITEQLDGASRRGPGYEIRTLPDNKRRLVVTTDDGDTVTGTGANIEEALAALEARIA